MARAALNFMQFQIPQFIDVEDKIIGPLTIKQFLYIAGAGAIIFILYLVVQPWLWFVLSAIVLGIGVGLAFFKINGQPLPKIILLALNYYIKPQTYVWQTENSKLPKEEGLKEEGFSLEKLMSGFALKSARRYVETGSHAAEDAPGGVKGKSKESYQIFRNITGERRAAKRVDYR